MAFVAVVGCAVRRVSAPGIALANAQMGQLVAVFVAAFGCAVWACLATRNWTRECADGPAGGWHCSSRRVADRRWPTARGERAGGGRWGDWHALSPPRCEQHACRRKVDPRLSVTARPCFWVRPSFLGFWVGICFSESGPAQDIFKKPSLR